MGIHWHGHGWDCPDCGEYSLVQADATDHDAEYARLTKEAADHSRDCMGTLDPDKPLNRGRRGTFADYYAAAQRGDLAEYGEYNEGDMGKDFPTPLNPDDPRDDHKFDHANEFAQGFNGTSLPPNDPNLSQIDQTPEETKATVDAVLGGITSLLAGDLERARKMWKDGPNDLYKLPDGYKPRPK